MQTLASGTQPPTASHAAPAPGASVTHYRVWAYPIQVPGIAADDAVLRRYWVAAMGAGAVEDLLRMIRAAALKEKVRRPLFLPTLITFGLASVNRDVIWVTSRLPLLPAEIVRRLPHPLRLSYAAWRREMLSGSRGKG